MHEVEHDHNVLFSNWGSWKFSEVGENLLKEFIQMGIDKYQTKEPSDKWKFLLSHLPTTSSELKDHSDDDFLDASRPSDDDSDTEWDEIKLFTSKINGRKQFVENFIDIDKTIDMIGALVVNGDEEQSDSAMETDCNDIDIELSKSQNVKNNGENIIKTSEMLEEDMEDNLGDRKDRHVLGRNERTDLPQLLLAKLNADVIDKESVNEMVETRSLTKEHLTNVWVQLESSEAKIALTRSLASVALYHSVLCQALLLPWLSSSDFENEKEVVDSIAGILPQFSEVSVNELLLPLTCNPNGIFVRNLNLLADIMCKVDTKQWGALLRQFLNATNVSLEKWQLPVVIKLLESVTEDAIDAGSTNRLINLVNSSVDEFINDKNFGNLLIAVAILVHKSEKLSESIETLKECAEKYKGIMRFKVMSILKSSPYL